MTVSRRPLFTLLLVFLPFLSFGQFVDLGQDPASVRWRQINTSDFQIIYPDFFEERAREMAAIYERLYAHANTLGLRPGKISMIVRANGGVSNGNASWAPKKSELYATPPQDPDVRWLEHLCIHEFRHVVQYDKINQGFSRVLYHLFGEQYTMALVGLFVPMWLLEGDATVFETSATRGGRGRSPEFLGAVKARVVEKGVDPYRKAVLGSLAEILPDRYALGYFLVGNSRLHYGPALWQNVFERVGRRPYDLLPVSRGLQRGLETRRDSLWSAPAFRALFSNPDSVKRANTGWNALLTLYRDNFSELRQIWTREADAVHHRFDTLPVSPRQVANYHAPLPVGPGRLVAYKEGPGEAGAFVELSEGRERLLFRPGALYDPAFCHRGDTLLWSEYRSHPRWEHAGKMTLASLDLATGTYRRHPAPANRFAPFSVGPGVWGCVEVDARDRAAILLLDTAFREITRYPAADRELFIHPSVDGRGNILAVSLSPDGKRLLAIRLADGRRDTLSPATDNEIDRPLLAAGDRLLFRSAATGNNAIHERATNGTPDTLLVEARFGARYPSLSSGGDTLYFSFYTPDGYRPARLPLARASRRPLPALSSPFPLADALARQEAWDFRPATATASIASRVYSKALHAINVHSWGPLFPDRDALTLRPGIAASSQNKLSTFYWTAGFTWDDEYARGNWKVSATYRGLWPVFKASLKNGRYEWELRGKIHRDDGRVDSIKITTRTRRTLLDASVEFPINLSRGNRRRAVVPSVSYRWQAPRHEVIDLAFRTDDGKWQRDDPADYKFSHLSSREHVVQVALSLYSLARVSPRDLYPRRGERLRAGFARDLGRASSIGWIDGDLYLPGIAAHHAIALYAGYQRKASTASSFGNRVLSPRGTLLDGRSMASTRFSYHLPLAYPDLRLTPLLYVRRVSAGLFWDAAANTRQEISVNGQTTSRGVHVTRFYRSLGLEAMSDTRFLDLTFPVNLGFRTGYETQHRSCFFHLLFSIGLSI
ncbi:MAG: hypothetical protein LBP56_04040 [Odoribacteraceae bacterium]|jgi:hypothetical protein|nr:hypothetical protein [Odoribacteraceae bacterium]